MANISEARGIVTFEAEFYQKHSALINSCLENATGAYYGFQTVSSNDNGSFQFEALGRWNIYNTIPEILVPTDENMKAQKQYHQLYRLIEKDDAEIKLDYVEYEPGSQFLQNQTIKAYPQINNDFLFTVELMDTYDYPYTDKNIIQEGFEEGYVDLNTSQDMFHKFRDAFMKHYKLSPNIQEYFSNSNKLFKSVYLGVIEDQKVFDGAISKWRLDDLEELLCELNILMPKQNHR